MHKNGNVVYCEEDENFYNISYNPQTNKTTVIKLDSIELPDEYFEHICSTTDTSPTGTIVCAKSENHALERALQVFDKYFEEMSEKVSDAIYEELNNREKVWYAKFIPATKTLKLTCIREVPAEYSPNLVFVKEEGGYPKFFTFVKAKEYDAAWEKAFILFRDYINDCNDTLDYIDSENCTRASRKE